MNRLKDKKALITGGTSGIGLETAKQFLVEGALVAVTGQSAQSIETARRELGEKALVIQSDAASIDAGKTLAKQLAAKFGSLDAVFINAGIVHMRPLAEMDEDGFDHSFGTNVKGPYFLLQSLLPLLANPCSIVLNGSVNAHIGMPGTTVYGATKAALISLARTISAELIGRGVRLNIVSPGPISTPLYGKLGFGEEKLKAVAASIQGQVPAGRFGNASEIASAVVFLASDESAFAVGSELMIDGGMGTL